MALDVRSQKTFDITIIDLVGRLDALGPALSPKIAEFLTRGERHLVMNLARLEYIDAAGLGQLVAIWTSVTKTGGSVALLNPREHIRKLFSITKLDTVFEIYEGESQAVARGLRSPSGVHASDRCEKPSHPAADNPFMALSE
jgi:anti-sigma B factor antagonist